jgi:hypothetical protein
MKLFTRPTVILIAGIAILVVLAGGMAIVSHHGNMPSANSANNAASKTSSNSSKSTSSQQSTSNASNSTTPTPTSTTPSNSSTPVTAACKLLSQAIAQQILGANTKPSGASDTSALQATDTAITACAYTGANGSVQLIIRTPTSQLGTSENDTVFGSGRPTDAVPVQSYGQSAYWEPSQHQLNVLGSNNWYIITRSTNTQADAEAVAKLLDSGF